MANRGGHPRRFLDALKIFVRAGNGGHGLPKFGGIGGKGGDVFVEGVEGQTLEKTKTKKLKHFKAGSGEQSRPFLMFGNPGEDLVIPAPLGTALRTDFQQDLGEILSEGDRILVARGGAGGSPENQFAGQEGEKRHISLLLKLIADVGLVGFPNAGKSTFLRAVSHAKPKVASYPFTTLHPIVGAIQYPDKRQILAADLPGLIEGSWQNIGMGHKFLRHVERTKILLFVVDIEGFRLGPMYPYRDPIENVILLNKELELYREDLMDKPSVLLVNKMDKKCSQHNYEKLKDQLQNIEEVAQSLPEEMRPYKYVKFGDVIPASIKYNPDSVQHVKDKLRSLIDAYEESAETSLMQAEKLIHDQLYERDLKLL